MRRRPPTGRDELQETGTGSAHLPELLIDHTKLERVVDLMFIIRHDHLGRLRENKTRIISLVVQNTMSEEPTLLRACC